MIKRKLECILIGILKWRMGFGWQFSTSGSLETLRTFGFTCTCLRDVTAITGDVMGFLEETTAVGNSYTY